MGEHAPRGLTLIENEQDLGHYWLESRNEVVHILKSLHTHSDSLAVYFDQGRNFILSAILEVRAQHDTFVFDIGSSDDMNRRLLAAEKLTFVGMQEGVRVQWSTGPANVIQFGDAPAFIAWLPESVLRLQRREYYRIDVPLSMKARAYIPAVDATGEGLAIHDIGLGGICVVANARLAEAQRLDRFEGCYLEMGSGLADLPVSLEVRHVTPLRLRGGRSETRVGLCFLDLRPQDAARIQRFLVKVQQARRALLSQ